MPDEHESAVAAWLDDPFVQREIAITRSRFPSWDDYHVMQFTLSVMTYEALDFYVGESLEEDPDSDSTGWKP
jgi:hypothetical protein